MLAVGVGEILWDRLPGGDEIGGAPFNVVSHLARFGHRAAYVTAVGADRLGDAILAEMARRGIDTALVGRVAGVATGLAQVTLGPGGSPVFALRRPAAFEQWGGDAVAQRVSALAPSFLIFGTLAQLRPQSRDLLRRMAGASAAAVRLYDVNLRDGWWSADVVAELITLASVVKLSESEASELAPALGVSWRAGAEAFCRDLAARHGLRGVAVTAGPDAASLLLDGEFASAPPPAADVADAVGAGDAFTAALLDAIGRRRGALAALRRANALGTLVASRRGAQPPWTAAELASLEDQESAGPAVAG
jgi:fructokinase